MKNIIRLGDPTTHGGAVTSTGAPHFTVSGKPVALVGDSCSCPIRGHQGCTIVSGNARHTIKGKQSPTKATRPAAAPTWSPPSLPSAAFSRATISPEIV
ncbi:PAAR domain-containing protein [Oxalobacteraceae bacterium A2-2]